MAPEKAVPMNPKAIITGTGRAIPPRVVTNFDLEKLMNTTDEWIQQRSGIRERHYAEGGVGSSDLAVEAAARGSPRPRSISSSRPRSPRTTTSPGSGS
jgi:hypothetical protein